MRPCIYKRVVNADTKYRRDTAKLILLYDSQGKVFCSYAASWFKTKRWFDNLTNCKEISSLELVKEKFEGATNIEIIRFITIIHSTTISCYWIDGYAFNGISTIIWSQNIVGLLIAGFISYYMLQRKPKIRKR